MVLQATLPNSVALEAVQLNVAVERWHLTTEPTVLMAELIAQPRLAIADFGVAEWHDGTASTHSSATFVSIVLKRASGKLSSSFDAR